MTPDDLPRFFVSAVLPDHVRGRFDPSPWVGENWIAGLYLGRSRFVWGRFRSVCEATHACWFVPDNEPDVSFFRLDETYPYIDYYWGERAELVMDESRVWHRRAFEPSDMIVHTGPDATSLGIRAIPDASISGAVLPGGWDHEHCAICSTKLGRAGEPEGYVSVPDSWVCVTCHDAYVFPRSIAFAKESDG